MENQSQKLNPRDLAVEKIIAQLERNPRIWKQTWSKICNPGMRPHNPITKTIYSGVNLFGLALTTTELEFDDNRWATYDQANNAGLLVRKGEKSRAFVVFHQIKHSLKTDNKTYNLAARCESEACTEMNVTLQRIYPTAANLIASIYHESKNYLSTTLTKTEFFVNEINAKLNLNVQHEAKAIARCINVFNFSQLENVHQFTTITPQCKWEPCNRAEQIINSSGVKIYHDQSDQNYYRPGFHDIHLTIKSAFPSAEAYYGTALHELTHAKINDGSLKLSFNPEDYSSSYLVKAKEELRAEISSIFLCSEIGLNYDIQNHASYLHSWLNTFKENKNEFWSAVFEATLICDSILSTEQKFLHKQTANDEISAPIALTIGTTSYDEIEYRVAVPKINFSMNFADSFIRFRNNPDSFTSYQALIQEYKKFDRASLEPLVLIPPNVSSIFVNISHNEIILNQELQSSIERGVNQSSSAFPPLFTPSTYTVLLNEINEILSEIMNTEPTEIADKIHEYIADHADSLISRTLSRVSTYEKKTIINQLNNECHEIINSFNNEIIQSPTLTSERNI